jgi:hypothetical protein
MTKPSPGPWTLDNFGGLHVRDATGHEVVAMPDWLDEYKAERDANARLIAAAPDLLEALKALLDSDRADPYAIVGRDTDGHPLSAAGAARKKARAAIAKAGGAA